MSSDEQSKMFPQVDISGQDTLGLWYVVMSTDAMLANLAGQERIQETLETDTHELESIPGMVLVLHGSKMLIGSKEIYERALSVPEVKKNVKEVLQVILTKCSHDRRHIQGIVLCLCGTDGLNFLGESDLNALFANLKEGIALVRNGNFFS